ncbi:hypothetical protein EYF80_053284 [Liparis tanakae]|uniref:Uncharacterized protein n=1 Tax=Liparis tanakae TaxID=230148 RepID=A0A4Z2F5W3_9TELE|nr:hypothetical protein EYF80_053284 [Liparis tanakae]
MDGPETQGTGQSLSSSSSLLSSSSLSSSSLSSSSSLVSSSSLSSSSSLVSSSSSLSSSILVSSGLVSSSSSSSDHLSEVSVRQPVTEARRLGAHDPEKVSSDVRQIDCFQDGSDNIGELRVALRWPRLRGGRGREAEPNGPLPSGGADGRSPAHEAGRCDQQTPSAGRPVTIEPPAKRENISQTFCPRAFALTVTVSFSEPLHTSRTRSYATLRYAKLRYAKPRLSGVSRRDTRQLANEA